MPIRRGAFRHRFDRSPEDDDESDMHEFLPNPSQTLLLRYGVCFYYTLLHIILPAILATQDTPLRDRIISGDHMYVFGFFLLIATAMSFYFRAALTDPGFVELDQFIDLESTNRRSATEDDPNGRGSTEAPIDEGAPLAAISSEMCKICRVFRPLRSRHCYMCRRCVLKFDHHCGWLGQCVGQKNHCWFWWFLLFQSFVVVWAFAIGASGLAKSLESSGAWVFGDYLLFVATVLIFFLMFVPICLFLLHTYLALTNQTSWEFMGRQRVPYLRSIPDYVLAFDDGVIQNLKTFCCHFSRPQSWKIRYESRAPLPVL